MITKFKLAIFSKKVKVIDPIVTWKGFISWVCMQNMKSLSLTVQKSWPSLNLSATDNESGCKGTHETEYWTQYGRFEPLLHQR